MDLKQATQQLTDAAREAAGMVKDHIAVIQDTATEAQLIPWSLLYSQLSETVAEVVKAMEETPAPPPPTAEPETIVPRPPIEHLESVTIIGGPHHMRTITIPAQTRSFTLERPEVGSGVLSLHRVGSLKTGAGLCRGATFEQCVNKTLVD